MASLNSLSLPQLYREVRGLSGVGGIEGYHVAKKYEDPVLAVKLREMAKIKKGAKTTKHVTKRGSYLEDQQKVHKIIPGPGKYKGVETWSKKTKSLYQPSKKLTYIEQIMIRQKKEKKPAPGDYKVVKSLKQQEEINKKLSQLKIPYQDRITYLDHVQYEATLTPGIGSYNPRDRIQTQPSSVGLKPQDWRKIHQEKKPKIEKAPDMNTYNPTSPDLKLFSTLLDNSTHENKNLLGKVQRFKTDLSRANLGPGKYVGLQKWAGKESQKIERHGLQSISKGNEKSVYYN